MPDDQGAANVATWPLRSVRVALPHRFLFCTSFLFGFGALLTAGKPGNASRHWAFQPVESRAVPAVASRTNTQNFRSTIRNPIDVEVGRLPGGQPVIFPFDCVLELPQR